MSAQHVNPFADYGSIVCGDRFLGRAEGLRRIDARIVRPTRPGNLAIIGEPRIGKSSLAYHAIITRREQIEARGLVPIWMNLGTYAETDGFFSQMVDLAAGELRRVDRLSQESDAHARRSTQPADGPETMLSLRDFFKAVHRTGVSVLFVLDEFDHARVLFRGNPAAFQSLRDLSYYPEYGVSYLTTSRRAIEEIEQQSVAISTFSGTCQKYSLGLYSESELDAFFARLAESGPAIDSALCKQVLAHAGAHPMLLDVLAFWLLELCYACGHWDIEAAADAARDDYLGVFDHMADLLREDRGLSQLLQIVHGPTLDVRPADVEQLIRRGLVVRDRDGTVRPFSDTFSTYLGMLDRETQGGEDLWPVWRRTEKEMRQFIAATLHQVHGDRWLERAEKAYPNVRKLIEKCREAQAEEEKRFKGRASSNLLDFTYPADLFELIFAEWATFQPLLGRDKNYWSERKALLSKIRNPLAHIRDEMLYDWERRTAEGYCHELLAGFEKTRTQVCDSASPTMLGPTT